MEDMNFVDDIVMNHQQSKTFEMENNVERFCMNKTSKEMNVNNRSENYIR